MSGNSPEPKTHEFEHRDDEVVDTGKQDEAITRLLAERAGLSRTFKQFPDDVMAAAKRAAEIHDQVERMNDPAIEVWPPMFVGPRK